MVALIRSILGASRMGARMSIPLQAQTTAISPRTFQTSTLQMAKSPNNNPNATGSEDAVHAEKTDASPEQLQKETAKEAHHEHHSNHKSTHNDQPTHSEDSVHADKHSHDPLPDHKKKSKSKK